MRRIASTVLALALAGWIATGSAFAGVAIESRAEPTTIRIGDVITYTVVVTHDESTEVQLPSPGENLGAFEIRDFEPFRARKRDGEVVEEAQFLISTFDVGDFVIPPVRILYRAKGDTSWREMRAQPISIHVESLNPDEDGDIRDIKPPLTIPFDWSRVVYWVLVGLVALGAAAAGFYVYRKKRRGESLLPVRTEPPRPAHEVALEELDALYHSDLFEKGEWKLLHIRLSEAIRKYIEGRFEVPALEMTTFEILASFEGDGRLSEGTYECLRSFLEACDLVKFAKYEPSPDEVKQTFERAYKFVRETRPAEPEPEAADANAGEGRGEPQTEQAFEVEQEAR